MHDVFLLQERLLRHKALLQLPLDTHLILTMSLYRGFKSFVVVLTVLVTCTTDAKNAVLPAIDNYTDESAIVRQPSFESETAPEEQHEDMLTSPAMVENLERTRNRIRLPTRLFRNGLQPKPYLGSLPIAALMREISDGRNNKLRRRRASSSLARRVILIRRSAAAAPVPGTDYKNWADQNDYLRTGDLDCSGVFGGLDARCQSLQANSEEDEGDFEPKEKRREFVVDLGKRFDHFRSDLGKRFLNDRQNFH